MSQRYQSIFKRYELKYLLTDRQRELLKTVMEPYMKPDPYGHTTIRNLYFDTDTYRLVRRSIEHPTYKEKLRVRSYRRAGPEDTVFVELKKKYRSVVYKRRLAMPQQQAMEWLCGEAPPPLHTQIAEETEYFRTYYQTLRPKVFLSYEREAFYSCSDDGFRITFDENILARSQDLSLAEEIRGTPLLQDGQVLLEIKTAGAIPLWLTRLLTEQKIFKTSFSKYGTAYERLIFPTLQGGYVYA